MIDSVASTGSEELPTDAILENGDAAEPRRAAKSPEVHVDFYKLFLTRMSEITRDGLLKVEEIAQKLKLKESKVDAWLIRGINDDKITKVKGIVRYQWQPSLFEKSMST